VRLPPCLSNMRLSDNHPQAICGAWTARWTLQQAALLRVQLILVCQDQALTNRAPRLSTRINVRDQPPPRHLDNYTSTNFLAPTSAHTHLASAHCRRYTLDTVHPSHKSTRTYDSQDARHQAMGQAHHPPAAHVRTTRAIARALQGMRVIGLQLLTCAV
jgi:hypothetical protein